MKFDFYLDINQGGIEMAEWKHWFPFPDFRTHQQETLCKIVEAFESNRFVFLEGPCGFGKSPAGVAIGNYLKPAYIATVQKHLQDQYYNDFKLPILKGKGNYECAHPWKDDDGRALRFTCDTAPCGLNISSKRGKGVSADCKEGGLCPYMNARDNAFSADVSLLNFSNLLSFSLIPNFLPLKRTLILDECLPGDAIVKTDVGEVTIQDIVEKQLNIKVLSREHIGPNKERLLWKNIISYSKNPIRKTLLKIEVKNSDDSISILRCTEEHRVLKGTYGRNGCYVYARDLSVGDRLHVVQGIRKISGLAIWFQNVLGLLKLASKRFATLVSPWIISSIRYKLGIWAKDEEDFQEEKFKATVPQAGNSHNLKKGFSEITSIEVIEHNDFVYDIGVAETHNFYADDINVHNCHNLESELYKFAEISFNPRSYQDIIMSLATMKILERGFRTIDEAVDFCEIVNPLLLDRYKFITNSKASPKEQRKAEDLLRMAQKNLLFTEEYKISNRDYVIKPSDAGPGCKISPLRVDHMGELAFKCADKTLLMSATILNADIMAKSLGIKKFEFIQVPSTFPAKNKVTISIPVGSMGYKNIQNTFPDMIKMTKKITNKHANEKGLIQTFNYRIVSMLQDGLGDYQGKHRFLFHTRDSSKDELIKEHFESEEPTILVGPGFKEGIDLKDHLCRWQILLKMPCPDLKDPVIAARSKSEPEWYALSIAMSITQMLGRSVRSKDDYAIHYILDSYFEMFYERNRHLFSPDVRESIQFAEYRG